MTDHEEPAETASRRQRATALALAGADYTQIAGSLGYPTPEACRDDVAAELMARARAADTVALEVARLDRLQTGLWKAATGGDVRAAALVRSIIADRLALTRPAQTALPHLYEPGCEPAA